MKSPIVRSAKALKTLAKSRGASMVEYALLLTLMIIVGATVFRTLGHTVATKAQESNDQLAP